LSIGAIRIIAVARRIHSVKLVIVLCEWKSIVVVAAAVIADTAHNCIVNYELSLFFLN